jgi:hydroxypyruvate isomerase
MSTTLRFAGHLGLSSPDTPLLGHLARSTAPLDQIDALADHGLSGVQDLFLKLRPAREQAAMARATAARGLSLTSFGGDPLHWNTPLWSGGDRAAQQESVAASAALARLFGGAGAVCVAALDPHRTPDEQVAAMIDNLRAVAQTAAQSGLVLLVEPIAAQRIPDMLLDRLEPAVEIVRAVAAPSVRLMFDIGHVAMMGHDVGQALHECRDVVGLVQACDVDGRNRVDVGLGALDWRAIFQALHDIGHAGIVELEHEPVDASAGGEAAMLHRLARIAVVA